MKLWPWSGGGVWARTSSFISGLGNGRRRGMMPDVDEQSNRKGAMVAGSPCDGDWVWGGWFHSVPVLWQCDPRLRQYHIVVLVVDQPVAESPRGERTWLAHPGTERVAVVEKPS